MLIKSFVIILASCCCVLALPVQLSDNAKSAVKEFDRIIEELEQLFVEVVDRSEQQFRLNETEDELSPSDTLEGVTTRETKDDAESTRKYLGYQSQPQQITYLAASAVSPVIVNPGIVNPTAYYQTAPQKYSIFHKLGSKKPNPVIYVVVPPVTTTTTTTTIRPTVAPITLPPPGPG